MTSNLGLAHLLFLPLIPYLYLQIRFIARLGSMPAIIGSKVFMKRSMLKRSIATLSGCVFWSACALAATNALSIPRYVSELVTGAEIGFVIDVSNSMLSDDAGGQRLESAKTLVSRLAASVDGAGLSVVAFRGSPVTLCPMTRDMRAFNDALLWAGPSVTSAAGSDIGAAIDEAARPSLQPGISRVIVVLSDGNDTGGNAQAAAERAAASGAVLAFVGFGSQKPVPVRDPDGLLVRGADGQVIETRLDGATMRAWARAGKGLYVGFDESNAYTRIASICTGAALSKGLRRDVRVETDVSPALAIIALASLGLALLLSLPPGTIKRGRGGRYV
ncbi:MAG: VWA domain-containing protein [Spirochaetia bacterium]|jgi:hypothetical protein|nr:VWA domain-containing protein [Spirochaetia bacterium]